MAKYFAWEFDAENTQPEQLVGFYVASGDTSSHGCQEGWAGKVVAVEGDALIAEIEANSYCCSCWQTGCVFDENRQENDQVGRKVRFPFNSLHPDFTTTQWGWVL